MNNIIANFDQILLFAKDYGLPPQKKRAILREYLQTKILSLMYQEKVSKNLFFVGGTSLRLLRGLDRFSEDLDFDAKGITNVDINSLLRNIVKNFERENIPVVFYKQTGAKRSHHEFRFPNLLYNLGLSPNREENLTVKFDFEFFWQGQEREIVFLNRYGFLANIVTKTMNQIVVEKLSAYLTRKQTLARDIYDIVWLASRGAKPDWTFARKNNIFDQIINLALSKFNRERRHIDGLKSKLAPFLFEEKNVFKLSFFPNIIENFRK